jgi:hypothetical protein
MDTTSLNEEKVGEGSAVKYSLFKAAKMERMPGSEKSGEANVHF